MNRVWLGILDRGHREGGMKELGLSGNCGWLGKSRVGGIGAVGRGQRAGGRAGKGGGSWCVLFALLRCLDSTLKIVRELLKDLKQEWNLTKCAFLI